MYSDINRLFIFLPRNLSNQESIDKSFAIAKYAYLNNSFESNNILFKSSIQILKSLFEQNQKCEIDNFFSSMFQNNICLAEKEMNNNLEIFLIDLNLYSNYAKHLLNRHSSFQSKKPVNILIDYKVCAIFNKIHYFYYKKKHNFKRMKAYIK